MTDLICLVGGKSEQPQHVFGHPIGGRSVVTLRLLLQQLAEPQSAPPATATASLGSSTLNRPAAAAFVMSRNARGRDHAPAPASRARPRAGSDSLRRRRNSRPVTGSCRRTSRPDPRSPSSADRARRHGRRAHRLPLPRTALPALEVVVERPHPDVGRLRDLQHRHVEFPAAINSCAACTRAARVRCFRRSSRFTGSSCASLTGANDSRMSVLMISSDPLD